MKFFGIRNIGAAIEWVQEEAVKLVEVVHEGLFAFVDEGTEYVLAGCVVAGVSFEVERMEGPFVEVVTPPTPAPIGTHSVRALLASRTEFFGVRMAGYRSSVVGESVAVHAVVLVVRLGKRTVLGLELEHQEVEVDGHSVQQRHAQVGR
jgi:hypothetical protein